MPKLGLVTNDEVLGHALGRPLTQKLGYDLVLLSSIPEARAELDADLILYETSLQRPIEEHIAVLNRHAHCIPIVAILKYSNVGYTESLIRTGIVDYVTIPCTAERLQTTIRNALALHHLRDSINHLLQNEHPRHRLESTIHHTRHITLLREDGAFKQLEEIQTEIILLTLDMHHGCLARTAKKLGIGRTTLYRKLKQVTNKSKELVQALNTPISNNSHNEHNGYFTHKM